MFWFASVQFLRASWLDRRNAFQNTTEREGSFCSLGWFWPESPNGHVLRGSLLGCSGPNIPPAVGFPSPAESNAREVPAVFPHGVWTGCKEKFGKTDTFQAYAVAPAPCILVAGGTNQIARILAAWNTLIVLDRLTGCARPTHVNQHTETPAQPSEVIPSNRRAKTTPCPGETSAFQDAAPEGHSGDRQSCRKAGHPSTLRLYR